jgi:hypothetical protein
LVANPEPSSTSAFVEDIPTEGIAGEEAIIFILCLCYELGFYGSKLGLRLEVLQ